MIQYGTARVETSYGGGRHQVLDARDLRAYNSSEADSRLKLSRMARLSALTMPRDIRWVWCDLNEICRFEV